MSKIRELLDSVDVPVIMSAEDLRELLLAALDELRGKADVSDPIVSFSLTKDDPNVYVFGADYKDSVFRNVDIIIPSNDDHAGTASQVQTKENDADRYGNNCIRYTHKPGYPVPATPGSCKGCRYSHDPNLYDAGCRHPGGFFSRTR